MASLASLLRRISGSGSDSSATDEGGADVEFLIPNMVCEGCAEKLDGALHSLKGVRQTWSDVRHKRIRVRYEPAKIQPQQLKDAVAAAGFTAVDPPTHSCRHR
jgi:copper chaperone CopZ